MVFTLMPWSRLPLLNTNTAIAPITMPAHPRGVKKDNVLNGYAKAGVYDLSVFFRGVKI